MTTEYKNLSLDLKYQYEAKVRLLKVYKALLIQGFTLESSNTFRVKTVNNYINKELINNIINTKEDLRAIHLVRAFIKGVPYKLLEPSTNKRIPYCYWVLEMGLEKHYNLGKEIKATQDRVIQEFYDWVHEGKPSKFFAKPEKIVKADPSLVMGVDANGSIIESGVL